MKVKIVENSWLPKLLGANGVTLYPWIHLDRSLGEALRTHLVQHEWVHVEQIRKVGWLRFYVSYLLEWAKHMVELRNCQAAYYAISYEAEAYASQTTVEIPGWLQACQTEEP